jgi:uncharacterized protein (TIGR02172 family)
MVTKGVRLGRGRTAEVYEYGENEVLKLFLPGFSAEAVTREFELSSLAADSGLPVPKVLGRATHNGRSGIVYERVQGVTLTRWAIENPLRVRGAGRILAELHSAIHKVQVDPTSPVPSQQESWARTLQNTDVPESARNSLPQWLAAIPQANALCHGDFHPDNVIMTAQGPMVIDWMTGTRGDPAADVARTWLILSTPALPPEVPMKPLVRMIRHYFRESYLQTYLKISGIPMADILFCRRAMAALRTAEGILGEREYLLRIIDAPQAP